MELTSGRPEVALALIDGPVAADHPDLSASRIREVPGGRRVLFRSGGSIACAHGTCVAGILSARRGSAAPAICPDCTLLLCPIFSETGSANGHLPGAAPAELAAAIVECVGAGARVINMSVALAQPSTRGERRLEESLDHAARRGVIVVAAAGNQGTVGSSAITRHPWVIPVAACDLQGRPLRESNLGGSMGRRGLCAPGESVTSLGVEGRPLTSGGTSIAAPFVTGAVALLWSEFPAATASQVKLAVTQGRGARRATVVPPLLDAWAAFQSVSGASVRR